MHSSAAFLRVAAPVALLLSFALVPVPFAVAADDAAPPPAADTPAAPAATKPVVPPRTFAKPAEAVLAWIEALERNDDAALAALLGSEGADLVTDGKDARVAAERSRLARLARTAWSFDRAHEAEGVLRFEVGVERLPMAIPVAKVDGAWRFDAAAGRAELLARRIGRNELEAIGLCRQYVEMQVDYASKDRDGDGVREYAQRVASTPGTQDGLYWEAAAKNGAGDDVADPSPLGLALSTIGDAGADAVPYGGYRWSILKAQGANAPGGAHDYVINGNMIAGFALVAAPAEYRITGVMTFLTSNHGKVFQKDLGPTTAELVAALTTFDPDATWAEVLDVDDAVAGLAVAMGLPGGAARVHAANDGSAPAAPKTPGAGPSVAPGCPPLAPAAPPAVAPPSEPMPSEPLAAPTAADPLGVFEVTYADGTHTTVTVTDPATLTWLVVDGPTAGATGTETVDRRQVAPDLWYVSWEEDGGTVVTQIVDLRKMTVLSTRAREGKRTVLEGKILRVK